jgi:hypothetical protein
MLGYICYQTNLREMDEREKKKYSCRKRTKTSHFSCTGPRQRTNQDPTSVHGFVRFPPSSKQNISPPVLDTSSTRTGMSPVQLTRGWISRPEGALVRAPAIVFFRSQNATRRVAVTMIHTVQYCRGEGTAIDHARCSWDGMEFEFDIWGKTGID